MLNEIDVESVDFESVDILDSLVEGHREGFTGFNADEILADDVSDTESLEL